VIRGGRPTPGRLYEHLPRPTWNRAWPFESSCSLALPRMSSATLCAALEWSASVYWRKLKLTAKLESNDVI